MNIFSLNKIVIQGKQYLAFTIISTDLFLRSIYHYLASVKNYMKIGSRDPKISNLQTNIYSYLFAYLEVDSELNPSLRSFKYLSAEKRV